MRIPCRLNIAGDGTADAAASAAKTIAAVASGGTCRGHRITREAAGLIRTRVTGLRQQEYSDGETRVWRANTDSLGPQSFQSATVSSGTADGAKKKQSSS